MLDTGEGSYSEEARQASALPMQVVGTYARAYFADMDALGVQRPDISPAPAPTSPNRSP